MINGRWPHGLSVWNWVCDSKSWIVKKCKKIFYHLFNSVKYLYLPSDTFRKHVERHVTCRKLAFKFTGYCRQSSYTDSAVVFTLLPAVAWDLKSQFPAGYMHFNICFKGVSGKIGIFHNEKLPIEVFWFFCLSRSWQWAGSYVMIFVDRRPNVLLLTIFKCLFIINQCLLIVKVLAGAFNKEKAAGAFSRHCENFSNLRWQLFSRVQVPEVLVRNIRGVYRGVHRVQLLPQPLHLPLLQLRQPQGGPHHQQLLHQQSGPRWKVSGEWKMQLPLLHYLVYVLL